MKLICFLSNSTGGFLTLFSFWFFFVCVQGKKLVPQQLLKKSQQQTKQQQQQQQQRNPRTLECVYEQIFFHAWKSSSRSWIPQWNLLVWMIWTVIHGDKKAKTFVLIRLYGSQWFCKTCGMLVGLCYFLFYTILGCALPLQGVVFTRVFQLSLVFCCPCAFSSLLNAPQFHLSCNMLVFPLVLCPLFATMCC